MNRGGQENHAIGARIMNHHHHEIDSFYADGVASTRSACVRQGHEDTRRRSISGCTGAECDAGESALKTSFRSSRTSRAYSCAHGDTGLGKKYGAWYGSVRRPGPTPDAADPEGRSFSLLRLRSLHFRTGVTIFRTVTEWKALKMLGVRRHLDF
jgi:hypothetical protein